MAALIYRHRTATISNPNRVSLSFSLSLPLCCFGGFFFCRLRAVSVYFPGTVLHILRWQWLVNRSERRRAQGKKVGQLVAQYSAKDGSREQRSRHRPVVTGGGRRGEARGGGARRRPPNTCSIHYSTPRSFFLLLRMRMRVVADGLCHHVCGFFFLLSLTNPFYAGVDM